MIDVKCTIRRVHGLLGGSATIGLALSLGCTPTRATLLSEIQKNREQLAGVPRKLDELDEKLDHVDASANTRDRANRLLAAQANDASRMLLQSTDALFDEFDEISRFMETISDENKQVKRMLEDERKKAEAERAEHDAELARLKIRIEGLSRAIYDGHEVDDHGKVFFGGGSYELEVKSVEYLAGFAEIVAEEADTRYEFEVRGYASPDGSEKDNERLSLLRAAAVKECLVEHGLDGELIWIDGEGVALPVGVDEADMARRRSVHIIIRRSLRRQPS